MIHAYSGAVGTTTLRGLRKRHWLEWLNDAHSFNGESPAPMAVGDIDAVTPWTQELVASRPPGIRIPNTRSKGDGCMDS